MLNPFNNLSKLLKFLNIKIDFKLSVQIKYYLYV